MSLDAIETRVVDIPTQDGLILNADFGQVTNNQRGIILAHGITTNRSRESVLVAAEPILNSAGFSTLRFDFRGHGLRQLNSEQEVTIPGTMADIDTMVKFFQEQGIKRIGLAGASFGGAISVLYAADHPQQIQALFLENPVLDFDPVYLHPKTPWGKEFFGNIEERVQDRGYLEVGAGRFRLGQILFEEMQQYRPFDALAEYPHEIMVVQGDLDDKIDYRDVVEQFKRLPNPRKRLEMLAGGSHGFHNEPFKGVVVNMIRDFFIQNLRDSQ
ncbi:MAG: alpha/beta fold hydrolase [Candidatus Daviesbacteria bacterium]|nr:alpha/beta fold hydrolase [Candidatus Daviesbacteria bacterium]